MPGSTRRAGAPERVFPRRDLLKGSAVIGGSVAALAWGVGTGLAGPVQGVPQWFAALRQGTPPASPEAVENYQPVALSAEEAATLRAVGNRLIPADDLGPGAGDAGTFIYIDWTLAGPGAFMLEMYQAGLAALDDAAGGDGFAAADVTTQDDVLSRAEAGELEGVPEGFFGLVLEYTRQGMFGDPMYGGNAGFAGWDLIQYPGLKLTWTAEEQAIGTVVTPAHRSVADQGGMPYAPPQIIMFATPTAGEGGTPSDANA